MIVCLRVPGVTWSHMWKSRVPVDRSGVLEAVSGDSVPSGDPLGLQKTQLGNEQTL